MTQTGAIREFHRQMLDEMGRRGEVVLLAKIALNSDTAKDIRNMAIGPLKEIAADNRGYGENERRIASQALKILTNENPCRKDSGFGAGCVLVDRIA